MRLAKFSLVLLLAILSLATVSGAPRAEVPQTCPNGQCTIYIPLVTHVTQPLLLSPADGVTIGSLAPLLTWLPGMPGTHQIQVSLDPEFSPLSTPVLTVSKSIKASTILPVQTLLSANLKPNTIYYWRVGMPSPNGYSYPTTRSFATPSADAVTLPPIVTLVSPRNKTKLSSHSVRLMWQPVPDVLFYRVRVYNPDGSRYLSDDVPGTDTSLDLTSLPSRTTFTWRVKALGPTGWSPDYSPTFAFSTP